MPVLRRDHIAWQMRHSVNTKTEQKSKSQEQADGRLHLWSEDGEHGKAWEGLEELDGADQETEGAPVKSENSCPTLIATDSFHV